MKKLALKTASLILSILLIGFLLSLIDVGPLVEKIKNIDLRYYLIALGLYCGGYIVRALRVKIFFAKETTFKFLIFISVQQFLNRVLPLRMGEFFFPILLKKMFTIDYSNGLGKLFLIRIMDMLSIVVTFLLLSFAVGNKIEFSLKIFSVAALILLVVGLLMLPKILILITDWLKARKTQNNFMVKVGDFINNTSNALSIGQAKYYQLFLLSVADKFINFLVAYMIMLGLGYNLSLFLLACAFTLSGFTEILPVNSIGSFGTTELGWAGALIYFGQATDVSVSSGLGFNIISFSFTLLLGVIGFIVLQLFYSKQKVQ